MFGINYDGLRKKKTYDELIDYVMNKQEKIQYPDRTAKLLRNSPQLSNLLDSNGEGLLEMEEQQKRQVMEVEKEHILRQTAGPSTGAAADVRTIKRKTIPVRHPSGEIIRTVTPSGPTVIPMDVDDDDELNIIYNMGVGSASSESNPLLSALNTIMPLDEVIAEIDRIEKEGEDRKKICSNMLLKILVM